MPPGYSIRKTYNGPLWPLFCANAFVSRAADTVRYATTDNRPTNIIVRIPHKVRLMPSPLSSSHFYSDVTEPTSDSTRRAFAPPCYSLFWPARWLLIGLWRRRLLPTRLLLILLGDLNLLAFHQRVRRIDHHVLLSAEPGNYLHFAPEIAPQHNGHEARLIAVLDHGNLQAL